ncbi:MAG: hypothetical protein H7338_23050 [Candidatus Sericytochromatia bacterium]|nr:hypothetical protein [Candidatus Sericytochromatia bacterium]
MTTPKGVLAQHLNLVLRDIGDLTTPLEIGNGEGLGPDEQATIAGTHRRITADLQALLTTLGSPDDNDELSNSLLVWWIEHQSQWRRMNLLLNYQLVIENKADPLLRQETALVMAILGRIEALLQPEDTMMASRFLFEAATGGRPLSPEVLK